MGKGEARIFVILNPLGHVSNSERDGEDFQCTVRPCRKHQDEKVAEIFKLTYHSGNFENESCFSVHGDGGSSGAGILPSIPSISLTGENLVVKYKYTATALLFQPRQPLPSEPSQGLSKSISPEWIVFLRFRTRYARFEQPLCTSWLH